MDKPEGLSLQLRVRKLPSPCNGLSKHLISLFIIRSYPDSLPVSLRCLSILLFPEIDIPQIIVCLLITRINSNRLLKHFLRPVMIPFFHQDNAKIIIYKWMARIDGNCLIIG